MYEDQLETALVTMQYEVSCKGFASNVCKDDYLLYYYIQVKESENWTEAEVSDITYVYGYVPSSKVSSVHASIENQVSRDKQTSQNIKRETTQHI